MLLLFQTKKKERHVYKNKQPPSKEGKKTQALTIHISSPALFQVIFKTIKNPGEPIKFVIHWSRKAQLGSRVKLQVGCIPLYVIYSDFRSFLALICIYNWLRFYVISSTDIDIYFNSSLSLARNSGCFTWVRHSSCKNSVTHSYQCV